MAVCLLFFLFLLLLLSAVVVGCSCFVLFNVGSLQLSLLRGLLQVGLSVLRHVFHTETVLTLLGSVLVNGGALAFGSYKVRLSRY